jgi:hypothetical protein
MSHRRVAALCLLGSIAVLAGSSACARSRPEGNAIVVALATSPVILDPGVGADEASHKAHQLLYTTLVRVDSHLQVVRERVRGPASAEKCRLVART